MIDYKILKFDDLPKLFLKMKADGNDIIAPSAKKEKVFFANVDSFDKVATKYVQTAFSAKSAVFPRCEELFNFDTIKGDTILNDVEPLRQRTVVFGSRPCDSAAFDYLSVFFLKENPDFHFKRRYENTVLISVSCSISDEDCFCTSVGLGPGETKGSDILLTDSGEGYYFAEIISDKGKSFVNDYADFFAYSDPFNKAKYLANVEKQFNPTELKEKISGIFDWDKWDESSLACFGCGTCAFSCPTCTCFDIQDESNLDGGNRMRLWDTCALDIFTKHASGHNPRNKQSNRWRNRVLHKFQYTDEQFGMLSCVGCGRCSRNCPAGLSILEQVKTILEDK